MGVFPNDSRYFIMEKRSVGSSDQSEADLRYIPSGMFFFQNSIGLPATRKSKPKCLAYAAKDKPKGPAPMMSKLVCIFSPLVNKDTKPQLINAKSKQDDTGNAQQRMIKFRSQFRCGTKDDDHRDQTQDKRRIKAYQQSKPIHRRFLPASH